jgi:putative transposase
MKNRTIRRAYKFRLVPTPEQEQLLRQHGGNARFVWNYFLRINEEEYARNKKFVFGYDLIMSLPKLKKKYDFLALSFSHSLQQVGRHFDRALKDFLNPELKRAFPTAKKKFKERDSFTVPDKFRVGKTFVFIPKIGEIKWVKHRGIKGKVRHLTVKQDGDQWYCSVNVEIKAETPEVKDENIIGIDVGLKTFATHSDGEIAENQKILRKHERKLKRYQRRLSKRTKGGSNRRKQRIRVSRLHRKIRNIRRDFQHKSTCSTIAKCDGICLENLNVKGMMSNHTLAKAISDCGWYEYKRQLRYKADWCGKIFVEIDRFAPSGKCCSECGWKDVNLCLSDRIFRCECCGLVMDRDLNASINIRNWGLEKYRGTLGNCVKNTTPGDDKRLQGFGSVLVVEPGKRRFCSVLN